MHYGDGDMCYEDKSGLGTQAELEGVLFFCVRYSGKVSVIKSHLRRKTKETNILDI